MLHTCSGGLFGRSADQARKEKVRKYQRELRKNVRTLERELRGLERQEQRLLLSIKREAAAGRMDTAKIMAKDVVRTRAYMKRMRQMISHLEAVSLRLTTMQSSVAMANCMKGVAKTMGKMNKKMDLPQLQKVVMDFERQNEMMEFRDEMMGDAMDAALGGEDDDDEEEAVLGAILQEVGFQQSQAMGDAPSTSASSAAASAAASAAPVPAAAGGGGPPGGDAGGDDLDAELQKRLDNLRRT